MNINFYISPSLSITDGTSKQVTALQVLIECMSGRKSVPSYIYEEHEVSTCNSLFHMHKHNVWYIQNTFSPEAMARLPPARNSPRIVAVLGEESRQYFIVIEQAILCQVPTFSKPYTFFSAHTMLFIYTIHLKFRVYFSFCKITSLCIQILLIEVAITWL